jgi:hypothetical protein
MLENIPRLAFAYAVLLSLSGPAAAAIIDGYPDVVVCRSGDFQAIAYLHRVNDDKSAIYMTLGEQFATVTPDGIFHRDGVPDCDGKSLQQLEQDGQTRNLH